MALVSWAQAHEDIYLLRALRGVRHDVDDPFYIDVGANDPEIDSVTKLFYDSGWRGVNVEPSPHWFARLAAQRPWDVNLQLAVSDQPGELTFFDHPAGGLGTLVADIASSHHRDHQVEMPPITVQTISLTEICERYAPPNIHFLKVDVEGAEGAALRSMDFGRFRPWVLCVESHKPLRTDIQLFGEWDDYLTGSGYRFAFTDQINRYYVAEEKADRVDAFAHPVEDIISGHEHRRVQQLQSRIRDLEHALATVRNTAAQYV